MPLQLAIAVLAFVFVCFRFGISRCGCGLAPGVATGAATAIAPTVLRSTPCSFCSGVTPAQYQFTFASVEDRASFCAECTDLNSPTYVADQATACTWEFTGTLPCASESDPICKLIISQVAGGVVGDVVQDTGTGCNAVEGKASVVTANPRDCDDTFEDTTMGDISGARNCNYGSGPATGTMVAI